MKSRTSLRFSVLSRVLLTTLVLSGAAVSPSYAAFFFVNTTADTVDKTPKDGVCADADGKCSLRAAIEQSNANQNEEPDAIFLRRGTYTLTHVRRSTLPDGTQVMAAHPLEITHSVNLAGEGSGSTFIDGNRLAANTATVIKRTNVIVINNPGTNPVVNIDGVTIQNGESQGSGVGIKIGKGCSLFLARSAVSSNRSGVGGVGISNAGSLTLAQTIVSDNVITGTGGGQTGVGAGISNSGEANIIVSIITGNTGIRGGGIANSGRLQIGNSKLSSNAASVGGAIYNNGGNLVIRRTTIDGNMASRPTGEPPSNWMGGGISNTSGGVIGIVKSTINNNRAPQGGGISNIEGGGIDITNSTISGNESSGVGEGVPGRGGAIFNDSQAQVDLFFSTITDNSVSDRFSDKLQGGGIANYGNDSKVTMCYTILAGNKDGRNRLVNGQPNLLYSGDCYNQVSFGFISSGHNVVGVVNPETCVIEPRPSDLFGTLADPIEPKLGPLRFNGGFIAAHELEPSIFGKLGLTLTHALVEGSPAIDIGESMPACSSTHTDQRGAVRPAYMGWDAGAFEFGDPDDVTDSLNIERTIFMRNPNDNTFRSEVTLTLKNPDQPIPGPIFLVLDELSANAKAVATGFTANVAPIGSPYLEVDLGDDGVLDAEGAHITMIVNNPPSFQAIQYTPRVLARRGLP